MEALLEQEMKEAEVQQLENRDRFTASINDIQSKLGSLGRYYQLGVEQGKHIVQAQEWLRSTRDSFMTHKSEFDVASEALSFTDSINPPSWSFEIDSPSSEQQCTVLGQTFHLFMGPQLNISCPHAVGAFNLTVTCGEKTHLFSIDKKSPVTAVLEGPVTGLRVQPKTFKDAFDAVMGIVYTNKLL